MLDVSTHCFKLIALSTKTRKFSAPSIVTTQIGKLSTVLAGIYVFQVNNRDTRKGVKYVQS